jgi:ABC-type spermidine/putrescine transport system permease subunit I
LTAAAAPLGATDRGSRAARLVRDVLLVGPGGLLLVALVAVPVGLLAFRSLVGVDGPTLASYARLLETDLYRRLLGRSLGVAAMVTAGATLLAWPAGWCISRVRARHRPLLLGLVVVPYLTSYLLLAYAFLVLLAAGGPLMTALSWTGLVAASDTILYTPTATVVMLTYEQLPIMVIVLYAASERIPDEQILAARSLGASRLMVLRRVVLPLTAPSLLAGVVLVFVPVAGSFFEAQILGGPNGLLLGNVIADQVTRVNNPQLAAVLSLVLLLAILLCLLALHAARLLARTARRRLAAGAT